MLTNPDRGGHLLDAQSSGRQGPATPRLRALKTREATTSGIWRSPERKPKTVTRSPQRTIISTPNTISDRCPRAQKNRARQIGKESYEYESNAWAIYRESGLIH